MALGRAQRGLLPGTHARAARGRLRAPVAAPRAELDSNSLPCRCPTPTNTWQPPRSSRALRTRCVVEEMVWAPGTIKVLPGVWFIRSSRLPNPASIRVPLGHLATSPERISRFRSLPFRFRRRSRRTTSCGGSVAHDWIPRTRRLRVAPGRGRWQTTCCLWMSGVPKLAVTPNQGCAISSSGCPAERRPMKSAWLRPCAQGSRVTAFCVTHARSRLNPPSAVTSPFNWTRYTPKGHLTQTHVAKSASSNRKSRTSKTGNDQGGAKAPATPRATVNHDVLTLICFEAGRTCAWNAIRAWKQRRDMRAGRGARLLQRRIDEPGVRAQHVQLSVQHHNGRAFEPCDRRRLLGEVGVVQWARMVALVQRVDSQCRHPSTPRAEAVRCRHNRGIEGAHAPRARGCAQFGGPCNHRKLQVEQQRAFVHLQHLHNKCSQACQPWRQSSKCSVANEPAAEAPEERRSHAH